MKIKRIILSVFICVLGNTIQAQQQVQELNFGEFSKPVPSVSSLSTYVNTPMSIATGIPEISLPLASIPTFNKELKVGAYLSYHVGNVNESESASEVGIGWSLLTGGVISREIIGEIDEKFDDTSAAGYQKNIFDDFYYYSFPGGSGKFKIIRNTTDNTFSIENFSPNRIKFDYTRESNTATLLLSSFTLTDEKGFKYLFNDYSISTFATGFNGSTLKQYKSAFFLTKILDINGVELVNFSYQKDSKFKPNTTQLIYKTCKLKNIETVNFGNISFDYKYPDMEGTMNDPYRLNSVTIKDKNLNVINQYLFEYSSFGFNYGYEIQNKRTLQAIKKTNKNGSIVEKTTFNYDGSGSLTNYAPDISVPYGEYLCSNTYADPKNRTFGTLSRINLPAGGFIEYNYEANEVFQDKNTSYNLSVLDGSSFSDPEIQFIKNKSETYFDTNQNTSYLFSVTGGNQFLGKLIYINFQVTNLYTLSGNSLDPILDPDGDPFVNYTIKKDGQFIYGSYCNYNNTNIQSFQLPAGNYTLQIYGTGGQGMFNIYEINKLAPPYRNSTTFNAAGVRIKSIKNYDNAYAYNPQNITEYEYTDFATPMNSSGFSFSNEDNGNSNAMYMPYVLYKNVKVKENQNGYTKYYFKVPTDYINTIGINGVIDPTYIPSYNLTKQGILEKKEAFDSQNRLISSMQFEYTYDTVPNAPDYVVYGNVRSRPSYIKSNKTVEKLFDDTTQNYLERKLENTYRTNNFEIEYSKDTNSDGKTSETYFKYATEKGNTALITANALSTPLEIERKVNGKTIEKTETKFENSSLLLPSSQVDTNPLDNTVSKSVRYDIYDSKGNLQQFTTNIDSSDKGYPVTIIWGYNQTLPIARIEGATLSNIGTLANDMIAKSNLDTSEAAEKTLMIAMDVFRNQASLTNFMITTYTYDPMIGVTTVTPPSGMREIYKYDVNNKLTAVVDVNGNILKEVKSNYKQLP
ncbi:hypothetical protein [Amniculibacterium sp. G2-70]|uniref:hypothetical protein n=1 Tax=Amniculibacterium sp. G2-70 TaxID=2767188 RepID=UPI0016540787|nr:hypothetical protein [Amniculibacterium sp. G2-70]